jgi:hypothetical protein
MSQQMEALAKANRVYRDRAILKRRVTSGDTTVAAVVQAAHRPARMGAGQGRAVPAVGAAVGVPPRGGVDGPGA